MAEFEEIYESNQGFIYKFLLNYCRDASLAEELTQETFFKAYINFNSLRSREKAPAWLCQIARNTYFAWYRKQKHTQVIEDGDLAAEGDLEETAIRKELSAAAMRSLQTLNKPYREVLMLSIFGGLSLKEISGLFGKSESWARVAFYRAKQKILEEMGLHHEL